MVVEELQGAEAVPEGDVMAEGTLPAVVPDSEIQSEAKQL